MLAIVKKGPKNYSSCNMLASKKRRENQPANRTFTMLKYTTNYQTHNPEDVLFKKSDMKNETHNHLHLTPLCGLSLLLCA